MSDDLHNHTLVVALNMDARAHKARIAELEQLCKDAAALLQEVPDFDSIATQEKRNAWSARRIDVLKRIEQEVTA